MACVVATPVLAPNGDFSAWLATQGVNAEVARALDLELGIRDYGVLRACVGDGLVRAELLATARDRLPFGFYAVLRQVVKAQRGAETHDGGTTTPRFDDAGNVTLGGLVDVLLALFSGFSRELLLSVQRLGVMDDAGSCTESSSPPANDASPEIGMNVDQEPLSECDMPSTESNFNSTQMSGMIKEEGCDVGRGVSEEDFGTAVPIDTSIDTSLQSEQVSLSTAAQLDPSSSLLQQEAASDVKSESADAVPVPECTTQPLPGGQLVRESPVSLNAEQLNGKQSSEPGQVRHHCDRCGLSFSQSVTLKRHRCRTTCSYRDVVHHSKTRTSDKRRPRKPDDKPVAQDPQQNCHAFDRATEGPHRCAVCSRVYASASQLRDHERLHADENLHRCDVCQQVFLWADHLKDHRRLHSRNKSFDCKMCGQAFSRSTTLKRHQMVHTGERPYKCEVCGQAFAQRTNCQRHESQHFKGKS